MREINVERFKACRRSEVQIGGHQFTVSRPTPWDVAMAQENGGRPDIEWAARYVVAWSLCESDLIPGGDPEPVTFNADVFAEWIKDYPDYWQPLIKGVIDAYQAHEKRLEDRGNV